VALLFALIATPAVAHQASPKYISIFDGTSPHVSGLKVEVLGFDNQYQLINNTGKTVVVYGYNHEPYGRMLPDGTVQINQRSPATYLNEDRFATTPVPPSANPRAAPVWKTQDKANRFIWHDHRMHWMAKSMPPQVKDQHKRTTVFHYAIPLSVNGKPVKLTGTLFWRGTPKGIPTGALIAFVVLLVALTSLVLTVRRRRKIEEADAASVPDFTRPREPDAQVW